MLFWMLYTIGVGSIVAFACVILERAALQVRMPVRFVWLAAVAVTTFVTTLSVFDRDFSDTSSSSVSATSLNGQDGDVVIAGAGISESIGAAELINAVLAGFWAISSVFATLALIVIAVRTRIATGRAARQRIEGTPVLVTENTGPALVGLLRYDIVIPQWVAELPLDQQMLVLEHERQHARVFDPALIWVSAATIVAFPWNPAFWLMLRRLRTAIELDCDRRVLDRYPDAPRYAALLLEVTERAASFPVLAAALSESTQLHRRITTIVAGKRPLRPIAAMSAVAGIIVLFTAAVQLPVQSLLTMGKSRHN